MSILSQAWIIAVIICSCILMFRMDKMLVKASEEEEHFVDDWEVMQQKKTELSLERERKKQAQALHFEEEKERIESEKQKLEEERQKLKTERQKAEEEKRQARAEKQQAQAEKQQAEAKKQQAEAEKQQVQAEKQQADADVIFMERYKQPGITLALQDAGHRTIRRVSVSKLPFTIGRSPENMLVLDDLCVARNHCRIIEKDGEYVLEDLGTSNQLFSDGLVKDQVVLTDQSVVYIGNVELKVELNPARRLHTQIYREPRRSAL